MEETDAALWARAVAGESACFGELFDRHARRVHNHCFRRTASSHLAEDLVSVVFLEAWRRRADVVLAHDSALPWLLGVATNVCHNANRSRSRYESVLSRLPTSADTDGVDEDIADRLDAEARMAAVLEAVKSLKTIDQDILSLCVWQELSYEDAAVALGIPVGTVQSRLFRARERLKKQSSMEHQLVSGHDSSEHRVVHGRSEEGK